MSLRSLSLLGCLLAFCSSAFASFGGCVISPENPTLTLGAVGGAAAGLPWLKAQLRARFGRDNK